MQVIKISDQIIQLDFQSQQHMCDTFARFQEHYESPRFRNQIFTLGQLRDYYAKTFGAWTYADDWSGMNIPSYVLKPFYSGLFDPLTNDEQRLLDLFRSRSDDFYMIGTCAADPETLQHEICHGLFYTNARYKAEVQKALKNYDLSALKKLLTKLGYCQEVLEDECHAYAACDSDWLAKDKSIIVPPALVAKLQSIKNKYMKEQS